MVGWRKRARDIIRAYPDLKQKEMELKTVRITHATNGSVVAPSGFSRNTEDAALKELTPDEKRKLDAVNGAIETTGRYRNGDLRLQIIGMVYWKRSHSLEGAAMRCHVSERTAYSWHNDFVALVDAYYRRRDETKPYDTSKWE